MLKAIIPSRCRRKLLSLFFLNPDKEFYLRQIAKLTDQPVRSVQLEIQNLCDAHIVTERRKSNRRLFKLDPGFFYHNELKQLVEKTMGLQMEVEKHLRSYKDYVKMAIIDRSFEEPMDGDQVQVTLLGRFMNIPEQERQKLMNINGQLPFSIQFELTELNGGPDEPQDIIKNLPREKMVIFCSANGIVDN